MPRQIDIDAEIDSIRMKEQAGDPATPDAGYRHIYVKSSGLYLIDDAGNTMQVTPDVIGTANQIMKVNAAANGVEWATLEKARYSSNAGTAIATGSATIVNFEDQEYDTGSDVTTGVSWKYTAPATGYYHISSNIIFQASAAWALSERIIMAITVDTVEVLQLAYWLCQTTGNYVSHVGNSTTIYLTAAQYISLTINQNSGSNLSPVADAKSCWISIDRLA